MLSLFLNIDKWEVISLKRLFMRELQIQIFPVMIHRPMLNIIRTNITKTLAILTNPC